MMRGVRRISPCARICPDRALHSAPRLTRNQIPPLAARNGTAAGATPQLRSATPVCLAGAAAAGAEGGDGRWWMELGGGLGAGGWGGGPGGGAAAALAAAGAFPRRDSGLRRAPPPGSLSLSLSLSHTHTHTHTHTHVRSTFIDH